MNTKVCVTICTRERPNMLARCLDTVLPQLQASPLSTSLVVVENGNQPSCRHAVLRRRDRFPLVRMEYELEWELGIPFARNKAVDVALRLGADWIVFIDDDEEAQANWFEKLTAAIGEWDADAFHGPVELVYPENHPQWMRMKSFDGGVNGAILEGAATNNTMAWSRLFSSDGLGLRFDTRLRFSGGSDIELFRRAVRGGAVIRWINDAFVTVHIPPQRRSATWLLKRTRRETANASNFFIAEHGFGATLWFAARKCGRLTLEMAFHMGMAILAVRQRESAARHAFKAKSKLSKLAGLIGALVGQQLDPYRSPEGE
jgi:succinoglycan biosynthesis protein ExoM